MKKILIAILLILMLGLVGCLGIETHPRFNDMYTNHIDYTRSLENHKTFTINVENEGHETYVCSEFISIKVYNSGVLELLDDEYTIFVYNGNWEIVFNGYYEATE